MFGAGCERGTFTQEQHMAWRNTPRSCGKAKPGGTGGQTTQPQCHSILVLHQRAGKGVAKGPPSTAATPWGQERFPLPAHGQSDGAMKIPPASVLPGHANPCPVQLLRARAAERLSTGLQRKANPSFRRLRSPLCSLLLLSPPPATQKSRV